MSFLQSKSMDWFLYDNGLRQESVNFRSEIWKRSLSLGSFFISQHYTKSSWFFRNTRIQISQGFYKNFMTIVISWGEVHVSIKLNTSRLSFPPCNIKNYETYKSVIRWQKSESQSECFKKTKHAKFSEKLTPTRTCAYQGVRNVRFSKNLACFVEIPALRFALLPYYRRNQGGK